jgi:hypothetical protein
MTLQDEVLAKSVKDSKETQRNIGEAGNVPYFENNTGRIIVDLVNIKADKTFYNDSFVLGRSILGSERTFDGDISDPGSYSNTEWSSGSLQITGGSSTGSWISPICFYPYTDDYTNTGSWDDTASCAYRYLGYTDTASVVISLVSVDESSTLADGFGSSGSDDLSNLTALTGSNMRIKVELGSPTSECSTVILSWKPAVLGSANQQADFRYVEDKITDIIEEKFTSTTYRDASSTTGSWGTGGSLVMVF